MTDEERLTKIEKCQDTLEGPSMKDIDWLVSEVRRMKLAADVLGGGRLDAVEEARDSIRAEERERCAKAIEEFGDGIKNLMMRVYGTRGQDPTSEAQIALCEALVIALRSRRE